MLPRSDALLLSLGLLVPAILGLLGILKLTRAFVSMIVAALGGV